MKSLSKKTITGIILVILSPLFGIAGTVWSIYGSFDALERLEGSRIDSVGAHIQIALIFSIGGIVGIIIGIVMIILGIRKTQKH